MKGGRGGSWLCHLFGRVSRPELLAEPPVLRAGKHHVRWGLCLGHYEWPFWNHLWRFLKLHCWFSLPLSKIFFPASAAHGAFGVVSPPYGDFPGAVINRVSSEVREFKSGCDRCRLCPLSLLSTIPWCCCEDYPDTWDTQYDGCSAITLWAATPVSSGNTGSSWGRICPILILHVPLSFSYATYQLLTLGR